MHDENTGALDRTFAILLGLVAGFIALLLLLPEPPLSRSVRAALPDTEFAIVDVTLFDGERFQEHRDVWVRDGRIHAVGRKLEMPEGIARVDGRGHTLLPGLIDAHVHAWGESRADALRFGVTTVLDQFGTWSELASARSDRREIAATDRADLFGAGHMITAPGGHGTQFGIDISTISDPAQAPAIIEERLAARSDWIKIVYDSAEAYGFDLPTLDLETLRAVIAAAHARDTLAVVHVTSLADGMAAVDAGADGLVHVWARGLISEADATRIAERGVFVSPTLAVIEGAASDRSIDALAETLSGGQLSPTQRQTLGQRWSDTGAETAVVIGDALESVRRLHAAGVPILAGSDAPNPGTAFGLSLHHELQLLMRAGLGVDAVLAAATAVPADAYGVEGRGRVIAGHLADLLLVAGDPRDDIAVTLDRVAVWKDGYPVALTVEAVAEDALTLEPGVLAHFGAETELDEQHVMAASDARMGGASTAELTPVKAGLEISGVVDTGSPYPWAGLTLFPGERPMQPLDLSRGEHLALHLRGDGRRYRVMLFSGSQGMPLSVGFDTDGGWQTIIIPIAEFGITEGFRPAGIAVVAGVPAGEYSLVIRSIELGG